MSNRKHKQKVLVAMSGGVDSSVAAALLLQQGYDVSGAFMKQWSNGMQNACTWKQDRRDALRVAAHLGIPLITLDFEKEYRQWVMEYMFREYQASRTPNPDVLCNKYIKFGVWLDVAKKLGFDYLATGHYAIIKTLKHKNIKTYHLMQAADENKDQTYFLHQLIQAQLAQVLFPVGNYLKSEVRGLARRFDLPTADRAESMGICFVGEMPMKEFLQQRIKTKKGKIVTTAGDMVGRHDGLSYYTIGQRSGLFLSSRANPAVAGFARDDNNRPLYVVEKRIKTNELVVGYEDDPALFKYEATVADMHWVSGHEPAFPLKCEVRLRHRQPLQKSKVKSPKS